MVAGVILVASVGHWAAHYVNFHNISSASLTELQVFSPSLTSLLLSLLSPIMIIIFINNNFRVWIQAFSLLFPLLPVLPLVLMLVLLAISFLFFLFLFFSFLLFWFLVDLMIIVLVLMYINARKFVRKNSYERFFFTHHLFIVFYALLLIHGKDAILGSYEYWKWFIGPGIPSLSLFNPFFHSLFWLVLIILIATIYAGERIIRLYRQKRYSVQAYTRILPERVLTLEMPISSHFK